MKTASKNKLVITFAIMAYLLPITIFPILYALQHQNYGTVSVTAWFRPDDGEIVLNDCDIVLHCGKRNVRGKINDGKFYFRQGCKGAATLEFAIPAALYGGETNLPVVIEFDSNKITSVNDISVWISLYEGYYEMEDFTYAYGMGRMDAYKKPLLRLDTKPCIPYKADGIWKVIPPPGKTIASYQLDAEQVFLDGSTLRFTVKDDMP